MLKARGAAPGHGEGSCTTAVPASHPARSVPSSPSRGVRLGPPCSSVPDQGTQVGWTDLGWAWLLMSSNTDDSFYTSCADCRRTGCFLNLRLLIKELTDRF